MGGAPGPDVVGGAPGPDVVGGAPGPDVVGGAHSRFGVKPARIEKKKQISEGTCEWRERGVMIEGGVEVGVRMEVLVCSLH